MTQLELLHDWLRDAHGMEKALGDYIDKSIKDFGDDETTKDELRDIHVHSTQAVEVIEQLLKDRDDKPSGGKDFIGTALGFLSGAGSSAYHDDTVKNLLVIHGTFHFAHACYVSLAAGAETCGDKALAETCSRLADERRETADWAEGLTPRMTEQALKKIA